MCYANVRGRGNYRGHRGSRRVHLARRMPAMKYLSKPPASGNGEVTGGARVDGEWATRYPALLEFCTCHVWDDGSPRVPGTLTVFTDGGQWKLCLNDKDSGRTAF